MSQAVDSMWFIDMDPFLADKCLLFLVTCGLQVISITYGGTKLHWATTSLLSSSCWHGCADLWQHLLDMGIVLAESEWWYQPVSFVDHRVFRQSATSRHVQGKHACISRIDAMHYLLPHFIRCSFVPPIRFEQPLPRVRKSRILVLWILIRTFLFRRRMLWKRVSLWCSQNLHGNSLMPPVQGNICKRHETLLHGWCWRAARWTLTGRQKLPRRTWL